MASLKALKTKIAGVKSTRKLTDAMKMVAASKLRRAQARALAARPYVERMQKIVAGAVASTPALGMVRTPLLRGGEKADKYLLLVVSADRGLAGGYNINIARKVRAVVQRLRQENREVALYFVGKKVRQALQTEYASIIVDGVPCAEAWADQLQQAKDLTAMIEAGLEKGTFGRCILVASRFVNPMVQIPGELSLVPPLALGETTETKTGTEAGEAVTAGAGEEASKADKADTGVLYEFEPDQGGWFEAALPKNLEVQLLGALLENAAGEQGARMSAMDGASRNAGKLIDALTLTYNSTRQTNITNELSEIVAGATAVSAR